MIKKIAIIFLIVFLIGAAVLAVVNFYFLPYKFKDIVITKASEFLNRKVTVKDIHYGFLDGFTLDNVTVYEKEPSGKVFVQFKKASFNIIIPHIFKEKKIIIPGLTVEDPHVYLHHLPNNEWNFQDLLLKRKKSQPGKSAMGFFLGALNIQSGEIELLEESRQTQETIILKNIELKANLSLPAKAKFSISAELPQDEASVNVDGAFDIPSKSAAADVQLKNIRVARYLPYFYNKEGIRLNAGVVENARLKLKGENKRWEISGDIVLPGLDLATPNFHVNSEVNIAEGFFKFTDGDTRFNAKNLQLGQTDFTSQKKISFSGNVSASDIGFEKKQDQLTLTGNLNAENSSLSMDSGKKFSGNLTATGIRFVKSGLSYTFSGQTKLSGYQLVLGPKEQMSGAFLSADKTQLQFDNGTLRMKGNFQAQEAKGNFAEKTFSGNFNTGNTEFTKSPAGVSLGSAFQLTDARIILAENRLFSGNASSKSTNFSINNKKISVNSQLDFQKAYVKIDNEKEFQGTPSLSINLIYDPEPQEKLDYSGSVRFNDASMKGLPLIKEFSNASGEIFFSADQVRTKSLSFNALNTNIFLSGSAAQFDDPSLDILLKAKGLNLKTWADLFADQLSHLQVDLAGLADVDLKFKGKSSSFLKGDIDLSSQLNNVSVEHKKSGQKLEGITGAVKLARDTVSWSKLQGQFQGQPFTIDGQLKNLSQPGIKTTLQSSQMDLSADINILNKVIHINSLKGQYLSFPVDVKGDIDLTNDTPLLDLSAKGKFNVQDLALVSAQLKEKIDQLKAVGLIEFSGLMSGPLKDWQNWELKIDARSPELSFHNYKIQDVLLNYDQRDRYVNQCRLTGSVYAGRLDVTSSADFTKEELPFQLQANLLNTDLAKLKLDTPLRNKILYGFVLASLHLNGPLLERPLWQGYGSASIKDGHLWEFNLLQGLFKTLLIKEFQDIVFTDGQVNFIVKNERLITEDLQLNSKNVGLLGKGWVDFNKKMDFSVNLRFSELVLLNSGSPLLKGPTSILTQAGDYLAVKVTGSLDKPQFTIDKSPSRFIQKTTDTLMEGVQTILEDLF